MRCPKCNYFFSEEKKICPKCGNDMGEVLEKLGYFPPAPKESFLSIEDFRSEFNVEINLQAEEGLEEPKPKEIEFPFPSEEGET